MWNFGNMVSDTTFCKAEPCFFILGKHKHLSTLRKTSFKQDVLMECIISFIFIAPIGFSVTLLNEADIKINDFLSPALLMLDFCIRFFFKGNPTVGILPYLCLPVKKQTLISYILISDFMSIWIWGCFFVYLFIFYQCGYFYTFVVGITFFVLLLLNNYSIFLIKTLMKGYSIFIFPFCLAAFVFIQLLFFATNQVVSLLIYSFLLFSVLFILNIVLKRDLYKELNNFAC